MFDKIALDHVITALAGIMLGFAAVVLIAVSLWRVVKSWLEDDDE